jgi:molybdopterin synthase catalytic subunit
MKHRLEIITDAIDEAKLVKQRDVNGHTGAAVCFTGLVRGMVGERTITALEYETYTRMAEHQFELIFQEIEKRWPVEAVRVVHRIGVVKANEPALWMEILAPQREEAFAACQFLLNEMKQLVPVWEKARFQS